MTHLGLSRREMEVVRCVLDNLDVRDIALRCEISPRTVRAHLERIYRKLGLRNRADLILLVFAEVIERRSAEKTSGAPASGAGATGARASLKR